MRVWQGWGGRSAAVPGPGESARLIRSPHPTGVPVLRLFIVRGFQLGGEMFVTYLSVLNQQSKKSSLGQSSKNRQWASHLN